MFNLELTPEEAYMITFGGIIPLSVGIKLMKFSSEDAFIEILAKLFYIDDLKDLTLLEAHKILKETFPETPKQHLPIDIDVWLTKILIQLVSSKRIEINSQQKINIL